MRDKQCFNDLVCIAKALDQCISIYNMGNIELCACSNASDIKDEVIVEDRISQLSKISDTSSSRKEPCILSDDESLVVFLMSRRATNNCAKYYSRSTIVNRQLN